MKYNFLFLKKIYSMFGVFLLFCNSNQKFQFQIFTQRKVILWIKTLSTIIKDKQSKDSDLS